MLNNEVEYGKAQYKKLQEEKNMLLKLKKLEENEQVKTYIKLLNQVGFKNNQINIPSDEELLLKAFANLAYNTNFSNNIFVYMGWVDRDDAFAYLEPLNTRIYKDLETGYVEYVYPLELRDFKRNNHCINLECNDKEKYYEQLRQEFFKRLINEPQEKVVKQMIKKYKTTRV